MGTDCKSAGMVLMGCIVGMCFWDAFFGCIEIHPYGIVFLGMGFYLFSLFVQGFGYGLEILAIGVSFILFIGF